MSKVWSFFRNLPTKAQEAPPDKARVAQGGARTGQTTVRSHQRKTAFEALVFKIRHLPDLFRKGVIQVKTPPAQPKTQERIRHDFKFRNHQIAEKFKSPIPPARAEGSFASTDKQTWSVRGVAPDKTVSSETPAPRFKPLSQAGDISVGESKKRRGQSKPPEGISRDIKFRNDQVTKRFKSPMPTGRADGSLGPVAGQTDSKVAVAPAGTHANHGSVPGLQPLTQAEDINHFLDDLLGSDTNVDDVEATLDKYESVGRIFKEGEVKLGAEELGRATFKVKTAQLAPAETGFKGEAKPET